jgi:hypothetical protein
MKESTMNRKVLLRTAIALGAVLLALGPRRALADEIVNISVNTSSLPTTPGSEVVFILTDGSGLTPADGNNTATLSGFGLGGGLAGAVDATNLGGFGPTSNLGSTVSLTDSSFLNSFGQFFTPGNSLSFTLDLTTNVDAGVTPDQFSMYIYDSSTNPIATTNDPVPNENALFAINIDSSSPAFKNYDPALVTTTTPAPEPSTLLLFGSGLASVGLLRRRAKLWR